MKFLLNIIVLTLIITGVLYSVYSALPQRSIVLGAWTEDLYDAPTQKLQPEKLLEFESAIDRKVTIAHYYRGWESLIDPYILTEFEILRSNGWQPMINVNPYYFSECPASDLPLYKAIAEGQCDAFLHKAGKNLSNIKDPFYLLFAWEMNNKDLEWSVVATGSSGQDFVMAWQRIHTIFEEEGATNVIWVFCPNTGDKTSISYKDIYPGDEYVDWTGIDGYNWGTTQSWSQWSSFSGVFTSSYRNMTAIAPDKPMMIAEVNTTDQGGDKGAWYKDMFLEEIPYKFPQIKAVIIYNEDRTAQEKVNWKVDINKNSLDAFKDSVDSKFYK
jgi:hypothetical protein